MLKNHGVQVKEFLSFFLKSDSIWKPYTNIFNDLCARMCVLYVEFVVSDKNTAYGQAQSLFLFFPCVLGDLIWEIPIKYSC